MSSSDAMFEAASVSFKYAHVKIDCVSRRCRPWL